jgi:uncharacterized protein YceK
LLIGATFLLGGCASMPLAHEPWVYAISRHVYTSDAFSSGEVCCAVIQDANSQSAVVAMLCVVALPFALDTVLLPITIPHDVWMTK